MNSELTGEGAAADDDDDEVKHSTSEAHGPLFPNREMEIAIDWLISIDKNEYQLI